MQLDVGEPHVDDVLGQRCGQLAEPQLAVGIGGIAAPRPEVDLVDRHGLGEHGPAPATGPRLVAPAVVAGVDDRRGLRARAGAEGHRVGVLHGATVLVGDGELVAVAGPGVGAVHRPHRAVGHPLHGCGGRVPERPVAHDRHVRRGRRPHREPHAVGGIRADRVGAEVAVDVGVVAVVEPPRARRARVVRGCRRSRRPWADARGAQRAVSSRHGRADRRRRPPPRSRPGGAAGARAASSRRSAPSPRRTR